MAQFPYHLHIVGNALVQPLGLQLLAFLLEESHLLGQIIFDAADGLLLCIVAGHEEVGGIHLIVLEGGQAMQAHRIKLLQRLYLVAPEGDAQQAVGISQCHIHRIALDPHLSACQTHIVAHVEAVGQAAQQLLAVHLLPHVQLYHVLVEGSRVAHAIDARHTAHHHHILAAREQRAGGREPQLVYLLVDGQILLYIGVGAGDIGFGLIVVVVAHVVLHGVLGKELLHLSIQLCGQGLVVAQDERGLVDLRYHIGYREGLAASRHSQKGLCGHTRQHPLSELAYSFGLVTRGLVFGYELEVCHR